MKTSSSSMMGEKYTSELLGVVIAQIAQTIGYTSTQSAPLELLEDILQRFIQELARDLHSQAEHANRAELNLKDALLSLRNLNINVNELLDYIQNVEPIQFAREVPAYPVKRKTNLNFLKPGSAETLTRPVHIFEYLPPMLPTEPTTVTSAKADHDHVSLSTLDSSHTASAKLLQDVKADFSATGMPKWCNPNDSPMPLGSSSRDNLDHEGHVIREISSVVMTTGGFISPAIEGKLPEAFVPDIIEKFKGLDAPPVSPALKTPEVHLALEAVEVPTKIEVCEPTSRSAEQGPLCHETATSDEINEVNSVLGASTTTVPPLPSTKPARKSKKKKLLGARPNDQTGDLTVNKAQEKAQRKALKMYQKLSKNQAEDGNNKMSLPKSIKNLNRGILSALPDGSTERIQLEKLIKKQTKQRQKQIKSQKQQRQLQSVSKLSGVVPNSIAMVPVPGINPEPTLVPPTQPLVANMAENVIGFVGSYLGSSMVENKDTFPSNLVLSAKDISNTVPNANVVPDEIKLASEPDRNKLNIFKKISKQKTPKALSPNTLSIGKNLFETASNGSPLISLPSGTTITPAPALSGTENVNMPHHNLNMSMSNMPSYDSFGDLSAPSPTIANLMAIDVNKPKKRGRKPGGKNQVKPHSSASITPASIQSPSKIKSTNAKSNAVFSYTSDSLMNKNPTIFPSLPLPMEPLNLSNVDQLRSTHFSDNVSSMGDLSGGSAAFEPGSAIGEASTENIKFQKTKEKKERKKCKPKYQLDRVDNLQVNSIVDGAREFNKKLFFMDSDTNSKLAINETPVGIDRNLQISSSKMTDGITNQGLGYVGGLAPSNLPNSTTLYPSNQPNMMPMLPLLHFPPRPGLIPSGPGLFPPTSLTGFNKKVAGSTGSNMIMPHPFMSFPNAGRSTTNSHRPSLMETDDNKSRLLTMLPLTDTQLERSYCNVAPLVPESMKISTGQIDTNKVSPPDRYMYDAKQSDECTGKDISHTSSISSFLPGAQNIGLLSIDESQTHQSSRSAKAMKSTPAATGNLGDPIEVSDDSSDDESKAAKNNQIVGFSHSHGLKSSLTQSSNLSNSGLRQHIESSHPCSMNENPLHSPISDCKPFKKQAKAASAKLSQPENNLLALAPSPLPHPHPHPSPFNINFMSNDKFSLAGGADLIPLSRVDSGLAYSSLTVPATSLAAGATSGSMPSNATSQSDDQHFVPNFVGSGNYDDITITPTNNLSISELRLHKMHKKIKKPKDGKIKKKKDKKDKIRNKEKCDEKQALNMEKLKNQDKKLKRDKKKEKQVTPGGLQIPKDNINFSMLQTKNLAPVSVEVAVADSVPPKKSQGPLPHLIMSPKLDLSPNQVPKLTLKLSGKSTPTPPQFEGDHHSAITDTVALPPTQTKKEPSPELARFSPLVTGPPKPKQCEAQTMNLAMAACSSASAPITKTPVMPMSMMSMQATGLNPPSSGWIPSASTTASATLSASSVLLPQQLMHPSKPMPKMSPISLSTSTPSAASVSPIKSEGPQTSATSAELNRPSSYVDAEGYRIWICPACGKVDDGSAMIGCDGCDAWYHWTCVGIHVAPNDNEDWFCRVCITKKKVGGSDKKKRRNKKK